MGLRRGTYSEVATLQNAVAATTLANGSSFGLSLEAGVDGQGLNGGWEQLAVQITGITTGTVVFEVTIDGTNWVSVGLYSAADWTSIATEATADGIWILKQPKGFTYFRARISVNTTGTITVIAQAA